MTEFSVDALLNEYLKEEKQLRREIRELRIKLESKRETILDIAQKVGRQVSFPSIDDDEKNPKGSIEILPDTFFNKSHSDAAAEYLEMVGHAVPIDEILDALKRGGATFKGGDHRGSLYTQLVRGTKRFVKIGDDAVFGLLKKYGNVRRSSSKTKTGKDQDANEKSGEATDEDKTPEENEESKSDVSGEE